MLIIGTFPLTVYCKSCFCNIAVLAQDKIGTVVLKSVLVVVKTSLEKYPYLRTMLQSGAVNCLCIYV